MGFGGCRWYFERFGVDAEGSGLGIERYRYLCVL